MAKPEKAVENYLVEQTEARGGWCAKMVDAGRIGAPDRELRFPGGFMVYAETKATELEKLRTSQIRYAEKLRKLGFLVVALHTKEQVDSLFSQLDRSRMTCPTQ